MESIRLPAMLIAMVLAVLSIYQNRLDNRATGNDPAAGPDLSLTGAAALLLLGCA